MSPPVVARGAVRSEPLPRKVLLIAYEVGVSGQEGERSLCAHACGVRERVGNSTARWVTSCTRAMDAEGRGASATSPGTALAGQNGCSVFKN